MKKINNAQLYPVELLYYVTPSSLQSHELILKILCVGLLVTHFGDFLITAKFIQSYKSVLIPN